MTKHQKQSSDRNTDFIEDWIHTTGSFWGNVTAAWTDAAEAFPKKAEIFRQQAFDSAKDGWERTFRSFETIGEMMSASNETGFDQDEFKQRMQSLDFLMHTIQGQMEAFQKQCAESAGKMSEQFEGMDFEGMNPELLQSWANLYDREIRKVFQIPQVGLGREYQERMMGALDKFHLFHASAIEFFYFLYMPLERTFKMMQQDLEAMVQEGRVPDDTESYYRIWLKKLESQYMDLFHSSEYTSVLGKALQSFGEFKTARDAIIEDAMQTLPIPTRSELDELYKELYALKRRVREMEKQGK